MELLENLDLLLLARRERRHRRVQPHPERHRLEQLAQLLPVAPPVDRERNIRPGEHEVFEHRHLGHEREVLVDHADAGGMGLARRAAVMRLPIDQEAAGIGLVGAHEAFHQRAFARPILAEQRVDAAGPDAHRHVVQRHDLAEAFADADRLQRDRRHAILSSPGAPAARRPGAQVTAMIIKVSTKGAAATM